MKKPKLCRGTEYYCAREVRFAKWERGQWRRECHRQQRWAGTFAWSILFLLFAFCCLVSLLLSR